MHLKKKVVTVFIVAAAAATSLIGVRPVRAAAITSENFGLSSSQIAFVEEWRDCLKELSEEYGETLSEEYGDERGIPWLAVMAKAIQESGAGSSDIYRSKNNVLGIDAYKTATESVFEHARSFDSVEDSFRCFYDFTGRSYPESIKAAHDPYAFLDRSAAKYASDPNYSAATRELVDKIALYCAEVDLERYEAEIAEAVEAYEPEVVRGAGATAELSMVVSSASYEAELRWSSTVVSEEVLHTLALGVIYGHFGNGEERRALLGNAYDLVVEELSEMGY